MMIVAEWGELQILQNSILSKINLNEVRPPIVQNRQKPVQPARRHQQVVDRAFPSSQNSMTVQDEVKLEEAIYYKSPKQANEKDSVCFSCSVAWPRRYDPVESTVKFVLMRQAILPLGAVKTKQVHCHKHCCSVHVGMVLHLDVHVQVLNLKHLFGANLDLDRKELNSQNNALSGDSETAEIHEAKDSARSSCNHVVPKEILLEANRFHRMIRAVLSITRTTGSGLVGRWHFPCWSEYLMKSSMSIMIQGRSEKVRAVICAIVVHGSSASRDNETNRETRCKR